MIWAGARIFFNQVLFPPYPPRPFHPRRGERGAKADSRFGVLAPVRALLAQRISQYSIFNSLPLYFFASVLLGRLQASCLFVSSACNGQCAMRASKHAR